METIDGRAASAELSLMESKISRVCTRGDDFSAGGRIFRRLWRNFFFSSNSAGPLWTQLSGTADFFLSRFAGTSMKLPLRREMKDFISHIDLVQRFFFSFSPLAARWTRWFRTIFFRFPFCSSIIDFENVIFTREEKSVESVDDCYCCRVIMSPCSINYREAKSSACVTVLIVSNLLGDYWR